MWYLECWNYDVFIVRTQNIFNALTFSLINRICGYHKEDEVDLRRMIQDSKIEYNTKQFEKSSPGGKNNIIQLFMVKLIFI